MRRRDRSDSDMDIGIERKISAARLLTSDPHQQEWDQTRALEFIQSEGWPDPPHEWAKRSDQEGMWHIPDGSSDLAALATDIAQRGVEWRDLESRRLADRAAGLLAAATLLMPPGLHRNRLRRSHGSLSFGKARSSGPPGDTAIRDIRPARTIGPLGHRTSQGDRAR